MSGRHGRRSLHEPVRCKLCLDAGVVFVKTTREDIKSLAMQCFCDEKQSKLNFWQLPLYSADHVMIDNPYNKFKGKISWQKGAEYWRTHMQKSKLIWDGNL